MRSILVLIFVTAALFTFAQSPEKGSPSFCQVDLKVYHADGSNETIRNLHSDTHPYHTGTSDTIVYELQDEETMMVTFSIVSFFMYTKFHEALIYGNPVYDTIFTGWSGLGGGTPSYDRIWSFADSALFTFFLEATDNPNPIHVVKLTRKPSVPLIVEEDTELPIAVFPNPTSGNVYIQLPGDVSAELSLVDASGRELKSWKSDVSHTLDLSAFQSGNYLLHIMSDDGKTNNFRVQKIE